MIAEINSSGAWTRGYVYAGGQTLAVQQQNSVSWLHQDPVTKSQRVTDANGTVVSTVELDPWGGDTNRSSNGAFQPKKYTTYERDGNGRQLSINYDNKLRMTRWDVAGVLGSDYEYRWEDTFRPSFAHSRTDATLDR